MRILILNWRDIKNPQSGGAEILTQEMAKRWVQKGHQVTQFSAAFPGCRKEEMIDEVKFIRCGSPDIRAFFTSFSLPVHFWAFWHYWTKFRGQFDLVVDEIHGLPFFTPLYVKEKKVVLICEVAKEIWDQMFSFPLNLIGRWVEKFYFRIYRRVPFLTISPSTQEDLVASGILKENITVLPMGVTLNLPQKLPPKEKKPTFIFVGRLCQMKGIEDAIEAFDLMVKNLPGAKFWLVGGGEADYIAALREVIKQKKLTNQIKFFGFVEEKKKFELLARARLLLHPSRREGWGLVVHEANSVRTPVVAYNSPGLRDIIKDGLNGLLCKRKMPRNMAQLALKLLKNKGLYQKLQRGGLAEAEKASWDKTAKTALAVFKKL